MIKNAKKSKTYKYSDEFRAKILAEAKATGDVVKTAKKYGVHYSTVYAWINLTKWGIARSNPDAMGGKIINVSKPNGYLRDVSTYLRHARTAANESLRRGSIKQYDQAHLLMMLALSELEKNGY